jgi:hypothetical protein
VEKRFHFFEKTLHNRVEKFDRMIEGHIGGVRDPPVAPNGRLVFGISPSIAEFERELIRSIRRCHPTRSG